MMIDGQMCMEIGSCINTVVEAKLITRVKKSQARRKLIFRLNQKRGKNILYYYISFVSTTHTKTHQNTVYLMFSLFSILFFHFSLFLRVETISNIQNQYVLKNLCYTSRLSAVLTDPRLTLD